MTGRSKEETAGVSLLGNQNVRYPDDYAPEVLETFVNKHPENDYFVKFNCPEFTSLMSDHRAAGFCNDILFHTYRDVTNGREQIS